jgi:CRP-like cAMP-binding protein
VPSSRPPEPTASLDPRRNKTLRETSATSSPDMKRSSRRGSRRPGDELVSPRNSSSSSRRVYKLDKSVIDGIELPEPHDSSSVVAVLGDLAQAETRNIKLDKAIASSLELPVPDDSGRDVLLSLGAMGKQRSFNSPLKTSSPGVVPTDSSDAAITNESDTSGSESESSESGSSFDESTTASQATGNERTSSRRHGSRRRTIVIEGGALPGTPTSEQRSRRSRRRHGHRDENESTPRSRRHRSRRETDEVPPPPPLISSASQPNLAMTRGSPVLGRELSDGVDAARSPSRVMTGSPFTTDRQFSASFAVSAPNNVTRNPDAIKAMLQQAGLDPQAILKSPQPSRPGTGAASPVALERRQSSMSVLTGPIAVQSIVLPPPPLTLKPVTTLTPVQAVERGLSREQFVELKTREVTEREADIERLEQHYQMCATMLNDQRGQLLARERALIERETAPRGTVLSPRLTARGSLSSTGEVPPPPPPGLPQQAATTTAVVVARPRRRVKWLPEAARILQAAWRGRMARREYRRIRYRARITNEILSSERTYIGNLKLIKMLYMKPVEDRFGNKELLTRMEYSTVFQNLEYITRDAMSFWKRLEVRMKAWTFDSEIGDIFVEFSGELAAYQQYVNHFQQAQEVIMAHRRKKTAFEMHCRKAKDDPASDKLDLESLLILPVQRIPRYILLLRDLHRHTPPSHPDYAAIGIACDRISAVAATMNERKRDKDMLAELAAIAERVRTDELPGAPFQIVAEGRMVRERYGVHEVVPVRDGAMALPSASEARINDALEVKKAGKDARTLLVFNDCLLVCRGAPTDKRLTAELRIDLANVWAVAPLDPVGRGGVVVLVETVPEPTRYPFCRARHYTYTLAKKEAASEAHCADMVRRAIVQARGTDAHMAQLLLEARVFGDRQWRIDLFREALSITPTQAGDDVRQLVVKATDNENVAPFIVMVEAGNLTLSSVDVPGNTNSNSNSNSSSSSNAAAAATTTATTAMPMPPGSPSPSPSPSSGTTSAMTTMSALNLSAAALKDGGARFFLNAGTVVGRDTLSGILSLAPRTVGALLPLEPCRYAFSSLEGSVAVQTREQLIHAVRSDGVLGALLYRVVCLRLSHLLQHVPTPTSAEVLAAAMSDANLGRRGTIRGTGGPSLIDPTAVRAEKDEELRVRFGLGSPDQLVKEFPCVLCEHVQLAGTLFVFNNYLCFGARFFDGDVRRVTRMADIKTVDSESSASTIMLKLAGGSSLLLDVGTMQRDVVLGMLRLFVTQSAAAADRIVPARAPRVGLWTFGDAGQPYGRQEEPTLAEERALQMTEADWQRLYDHCTQSVHAKTRDVIVRQGSTDAGSTARCYGVSRGGVSLERTNDDASGVTRFATLNSEATFNEVSLVLPGVGAPSVNAVALEDTLLYAIDVASFQRELSEMRSEAASSGASDEASMFEMRVMRYLAGRLRDALVHGRRVCTFHTCHLSEI